MSCARSSDGSGGIGLDGRDRYSDDLVVRGARWHCCDELTPFAHFLVSRTDESYSGGGDRRGWPMKRLEQALLAARTTLFSDESVQGEANLAVTCFYGMGSTCWRKRGR